MADPVSEEFEPLDEIGDAGLLQGQVEPHGFPQVARQCRLFLIGLGARSRHENHEVIGISDGEEHRPPGLAVGHARPLTRHFRGAGPAGLGLPAVVSPSLVSFLDQAEGDVGEQWRDHTALRRAFVRRQHEAFRQNAGLQEPPHQSVHLGIADAGADALHQLVMIDVVEAALDVALDDPLIGRPLAAAVIGLGSRSHGHADMLQGAVAAPSWSKPVRHVPERRLEDRLQKVLHRALNDAVANGRDPSTAHPSLLRRPWPLAGFAQGPERPRLARLGDELPTRWARSIRAIPQVVAKAFQKCRLSQSRANALDRRPIDACRAAAFVAGDPPPGAPKIAGIDDPVPQISIGVMGVCPAPLIELALNAEEPGLIGLIARVHGRFLRRSKSIGSLPAFATYPAFPSSDYYAGSVPRSLHLQSSVASSVSVAERRIGVPMFRLSTFCPLGGVLYPWRYGMTAFEKVAVTKPGLPGLPAGNIKSGRSDRSTPGPIRPCGSIGSSRQRLPAHASSPRHRTCGSPTRHDGGVRYSSVRQLFDRHRRKPG